jgi:sugar fermentation stimulation protein A
MRLPAHLTEAVFLARLNRFAALVHLNGAETLAHVPNSGRLRELLQPGNRVYLSPAPPSATRKTLYDLSLVDLGGRLVSADARAATALAYEWLTGRLLPEFGGYSVVQRERTYGHSRIDLLLLGEELKHYVEVKSVTLVEDGVALFPDAPTTRGQKHMLELENAVARGHRASVIFVIQRQDAGSFSPHDGADPAFGAALRKACAAGVGAYAYSCRLSLVEITLDARLPVLL